MTLSIRKRPSDGHDLINSVEPQLSKALRAPLADLAVIENLGAGRQARFLLVSTKPRDFQVVAV